MHYYPYGKTLRSWETPSLFPQKYLTTQNERDLETGYDHREARNSLAEMGSRFLSIDPLAADYPAHSPYMYVGGNPVKYTDPEGNFCIPCLVWAAYEVGSAIYDAYDAYQTVSDPNASTTEKVVAIGGVVADVVLPGGGYGKGAKVALDAADKAVDKIGTKK